LRAGSGGLHGEGVCLDIADIVRDELTIVYKKFEDLRKARTSTIAPTCDRAVGSQSAGIAESARTQLLSQPWATRLVNPASNYSRRKGIAVPCNSALQRSSCSRNTCRARTATAVARRVSAIGSSTQAERWRWPHDGDPPGVPSQDVSKVGHRIVPSLRPSNQDAADATHRRKSVAQVLLGPQHGHRVHVSGAPDGNERRQPADHRQHGPRTRE
jgi:hypothetical protein